MKTLLLALFGLNLVSANLSHAADNGTIWGGDQINLTLNEDGTGSVAFDCAEAKIEQAKLLEIGDFVGVGTFYTGHGGPARAGDVQEKLRTDFVGIKTSETTLVLIMSVKSANGDDQQPTLSYLTKGQYGRLYRCL